MEPSASRPQGPEAMRRAVADYVEALHRAYAAQAAGLPLIERAGLPLYAARPWTVLAAATSGLHLVATSEPVPPADVDEVEVTGAAGDLTWTLRFLDPVVLPELGFVGDDQVAVRRVLGVGDVGYHLTLSVGSGLSEHHGQHAGVALAHEHAARHRDWERIRARGILAPALVDELAACDRLGLTTAARLLAAEASGGRVSVPAGSSVPAIRRALLDSLVR